MGWRKQQSLSPVWGLGSQLPCPEVSVLVYLLLCQSPIRGLGSHSLVQKSASSSMSFANRLSEDLDSNSLVQKSASSSIISFVNRLSEDLDRRSRVQKSTSSFASSLNNADSRVLPLRLLFCCRFVLCANSTAHATAKTARKEMIDITLIDRSGLLRGFWYAIFRAGAKVWIAMKERMW